MGGSRAGDLADMPAPAREATYRALRVISSGDADLGDALRDARDPLEDIRDRALTTELVIGTLRWRGAIDYQLQRLSDKPLHRLDEGVLDALRLGAFQLLYLHRVPASAVVNDTVGIVKKSGYRSAAGFANAVLRRLSRDRAHLIWPERPKSDQAAADRAALVEHLSVVQSHPAWLVERWLERLGSDTVETWLRFNNTPASLTLAPNRLRGTRDMLAADLAEEGIETHPTRVAPHGLMTTDNRVLSSRAFRQGASVVQDEASQIIAELVGAPLQGRVWDVCAAPGGKTIALAAEARQGVVVATDVRPRRIRLLSATLRRCGASAVHVVHIAERAPFRTGAFDRVLVDAPCSGLGTVRRDPDIRWRRQPDDLPRLASAQRALLEDVAPTVAPGGRLIYSTCSSEPEENEAVVAAFLERVAEFTVLPLRNLSNLTDTIRAMTTPEGYLRTTPLHGLEAFFGAVLERQRV